jgi:hypothetical protein
MTTATSATPFSVQASPSAMTAGLAAQASLYGEVENVGQAGFKIFLSQYRAEELAKAEGTTASQLKDLKHAARDKPAVEAQKWFDDQSKALRERVAAGLSDPVLKSRYKNKASAAAAATSGEIKDFLFKRTISNNKTWGLNLAGALVQDYAAAGVNGNVREQNRIIRQIVGYTDTTTSPPTYIPGHYEAMAEKNLVTYEAARTLTNAWVNDALGAQVRRDIELDPNAALKKLRTPGAYTIETDIFGIRQAFGLDNEARAQYESKAINERRHRVNEAAAQLRRQEAADKRERTARHNDSYSKLVQQALDHRADPNEPRVTEIMLSQMIDNDQISGKLAESIRSIMNDQEAGATIPAIYAEMVRKIGEAGTEQELDTVRSEIVSQLGPGGTLRTEAFVRLNGLMQAKKDRDPKFNDYKRYRQSVNYLFTGSRSGLTLGGFTAGTEEQRRKLANALIQYDSLIFDDEYTPLDALEAVREAFFPEGLLEYAVPLRPLSWPRVDAKGMPTEAGRFPAGPAYGVGAHKPPVRVSPEDYTIPYLEAASALLWDLYKNGDIDDKVLRSEGKKIDAFMNQIRELERFDLNKAANSGEDQKKVTGVIPGN